MTGPDRSTHDARDAEIRGARQMARARSGVLATHPADGPPRMGRPIGRTHPGLCASPSSATRTARAWNGPSRSVRWEARSALDGRRAAPGPGHADPDKWTLNLEMLSKFLRTHKTFSGFGNHPVQPQIRGQPPIQKLASNLKPAMQCRNILEYFRKCCLLSLLMGRGGQVRTAMFSAQQQGFGDAHATAPDVSAISAHGVPYTKAALCARRVRHSWIA